MEKIEKLNKKIDNIITNYKFKNIIGTILFSGIGVALPRIFHILAGSEAGKIFLPMHIAVLIATLIFGVKSGIIVTGASILLNYYLTNMPTLSRLPYMLIELTIYAFLLNLFSKKYNSYISLILTIILGRFLYAGVIFITTNLLGFSNYGISVYESFKTGLPGIIIQIISIPFIVKIIRERLS